MLIITLSNLERGTKVALTEVIFLILWSTKPKKVNERILKCIYTASYVDWINISGNWYLLSITCLDITDNQNEPCINFQMNVLCIYCVWMQFVSTVLDLLCLRNKFAIAKFSQIRYSLARATTEILPKFLYLSNSNTINLSI